MNAQTSVMPLQFQGEGIIYTFLHEIYRGNKNEKIHFNVYFIYLVPMQQVSLKIKLTITLEYEIELMSTHKQRRTINGGGGDSRPPPWKYWGGKHIVLPPPPPW